MDQQTDYRLVQQPEGFQSVDPLPDPQALADFYSKLYYQAPQSASYQTAYSPEEMEQRYLRGRVTLHAIAQVAPGNPAERDFLEVGCGEGFLLHVAKDAGYHIKGIDFSDFGLKRFHPGLADSIEAGDAFAILDRVVSGSGRYDVCCLQNVLEHVIDPRALMGQVRRLLKPGGVAVISVPNDFSRIQMKAKAQGLISRQFWVAPPQHLHYFNTNTLPSFLTAMGFATLDAFADFPIEFFLYHPGSNYIENSSAGKQAHKARVELDLLLAENGIAPLLGLCQAMTRCGIGRNVTVIARPSRNA
jgi:2-polyprenyl-3-methyl-5-hydroxy-6-metoxy-1,4-benzoquinol methylase